MLAPFVALASALSLGAPDVQLVPIAALSLGTLRPAGTIRPPAPDLAVHLLDAGPSAPGAAAPGAGGSPRRGGLAGAPVCSGDVCQAVVSVPGFDPKYDSSRNARADAFAVLLSRTHVEPLAAIGRLLVVSGLRVDYSPSFFEPQGSGAHGWGNLQVRVRFRVDAYDQIVIPPIPR